MAKQKLILDFDGTLTDVDKSFGAYEQKFNQEFGARRGIESETLRSMLKEAQEQVRRNPLAGWVNNGVLVAPACADPYIGHVAVYQIICDSLKIPEEDRFELLNSCYRSAYGQCPPTFNTGVRDFLKGALESFETTVVTNSSTDHVRRNLESVGFGNIAVAGEARKYVIDHSWDVTPNAVNLPRFPRPVMLRRRHYGELLDRLGVNEETTVMGDIYELDLALPDHKGMRVVQIVRDCTPTYELDYMGTHQRGSIVRSLAEAADLLL